MHSFTAIFLLVVITTIECLELFHYPYGELHNARLSCTKDASVTLDCQYSCALEKTNMLSPQFDGVNEKEFGYFYKKYADACWKSLGTTVKPTCAQAEQFVTCFYNTSKTADQVVMEKCTDKFPVKNLKTVAITDEALANTTNFACLVSCFADTVHAFMDDGSFDVNCINPHIDFEFKVDEAVAKCEEKNTQANKCARNAHRYICMIRAFEFAKNEHYQKSEQKNE